MKLTDHKKTIVVSGGGSGIGLEAIRMLAESNKDYHCVALCINRAQMESAAKELETYRAQVSFFTCDLKDPEQIRQTIQKISSTQKCIYGLINNAGIYPFGGLADTKLSSWDETFDTNLKSAFLLTQGLLPLMKENGLDMGRVVSIASTAGILPNQHALAYSVSKAALIQFAKTIAKEIGPFGITSNVICPGIIKSPMHETYHESDSKLEEFYHRRGSSFPMGRVGEPRDVAAAIKFLMGDDSSWMTGEVLVVDGGRLLQ